MASFDLSADPATLQRVGQMVADDAVALRDEAGKLVSIIENLKKIWQDDANTIYVNDANEYIVVLKAIIDAIENHGTYLFETGAGIGSVVEELKNKMNKLRSNT
jgi:hypothetical protein